MRWTRRGVSSSTARKSTLGEPEHCGSRGVNDSIPHAMTHVPRPCPGRRTRRLARRAPSVLLLAVAVVSAAPADAAALSSRQPQRPDLPGVSGDVVRLEVRPVVGDTLRLMVEQELEMHSRRGPVPSANAAERGEPLYGPRAALGPVRRTHVRLWAHSLVEHTDGAGTTLLATTDSISMWSGAAGDAVRFQAVPMPADGRQVRVHVTTDGAMRTADPPPGAMELEASLAAVPGLLPAGPVRVGMRWRRDMPLPALPLTGYHADGVVQARLRLDSLTQRGRIAWISLEGELRRDGALRDLPVGTRVITAGTIRGTLTVDRQRAWIIAAATLVDAQSEVVASAASTAPPLVLALRLRHRITVR